MKLIYRKLFFVALLISSVLLIIYYFNIGTYLTLESLERNKQYLLTKVRENYGLTVLLYIALYIILTALSVPQATFLTLVGGFLFGILPAVIYVLIGATTGAVLAFLIVRYIIGTAIQAKYHKQLVRFNSAFIRRGPLYLLIVRLIPVFPFFLINILAAITSVSLFTFMWTTALGIIPGTLAYTFVGQQLRATNLVTSIFNINLLISFIVLVLFVLIPLIIGKFTKG